MSTFPALQPSSRSFSPGSIPISSYKTLSGRETRVILGDTFGGHEIVLSFNNVRDAVGKQILDHWYGQQGTAVAFDLPAAVYAGWSTYNTAVTAGQLWRYASEPSVVAVAPGIMSLSVQLVSLT